MQKKAIFCGPGCIYHLIAAPNWLFIMRASVFILLCFATTVQILWASPGFGQHKENSLVSVHFKNAPIRTIFKHIEKKAGVVIMFEATGTLKKEVASISIDNRRVAEVLDLILENTSFTWSIRNNVIRIRESAPQRKAEPVQIDSSVALPPVNGVLVNASNNEPLPGATIRVKGSAQSAVSDERGRFTINCNIGDVLVVSYVGFQEREIAVASQELGRVALEIMLESLDDAVVIGYGTARKRDLTGSLVSIKGEDLSNTKMVNISQALQGQAPGITVINTSGSPGAEAQILIRGQGGFGNTSPLFVIDGVISEGIGFIDPNDVQSLEILKDASAAAIYGSRAANGVVLITTKRGRGDQHRLEFSATTGIQTLANRLDFLNAQEWRDNEVKILTLEGREIPTNLQEGKFDPSVSTDWQDVLFRTALTNQVNISYSNSSEFSNSLFSLGYTDAEGIAKGTDYQRINFRFNSDYRKGIFKIGESVVFTHTKGNTFNISDFRGWPIPGILAKDADGNYGAVVNSDWGVDVPQFMREANPLAFVELVNRDNTNAIFLGNVYGELELLKGLSLRTTVGLQQIYDYGKVFEPVYSVGATSNLLSDLTETRGQSSQWQWENTLTYKTQINKHRFEVLGGYTRQYNDLKNSRILAEGFPEGVEQLEAAVEIKPNSGGIRSTSTLESLLGRVNYAFDNKYLFTATVRSDGSSRFARENRWGTFPSFSTGWVISEENFFQPLKTSVNYLKLRAGYGSLGSQNIGNYDYTPSLAFGGNQIDYILGAGQVLAPGVSITQVVDERITWETTTSTNFAVDVRAFENKWSLSLEYFVKHTRDVLVGVPVPMTVGVGHTSVTINAAEVKNKGLEATLGYHKTEGDFTFDISANLFTLNNKVLSLGGNNDNPIMGGQFGFSGESATRTEPGYAMASFYLMESMGTFKSQQEVDSYVNNNGDKLQPLAKPGSLKFKDLNNDGVINSLDKRYFGSNIPDFEYGLQTTFRYRNLDLGLRFQGVVGGGLYNGFIRINDRLLSFYKNFWTPENPGSNIFTPSASDPNGNRGPSDYYLEDATHLRLRNLQLGYNFPLRLIERYRIQQLRLSVTAQNLLTLTNYNGYDPEPTGFGLMRGVHRDLYPLPRTIQFGLNVTF